MKIQLKRSNVLEGGVAKQPTAPQMEYGELAVNYNNGDPAIFLKDSNDNIIRIAGAGAINNIEIPEVGDGPHKPGTLDDRYVEVTGDNMTGSLTIGINSSSPNIGLFSNGSATFTGNVTLPGGGGATEALQKQEIEALISAIPTPGNGEIQINGGTGITASGDNATANQTGTTTRTLTLDTTYTDGRYVNKSGDTMTGQLILPGGGGATAALQRQEIEALIPSGSGANDGQINVDAGTGLSASGSNATANQSNNTTRILTLDTTYTDGRYVNKNGDTMTGQLILPGGGGATAALQRQEIEDLITISSGANDGQINVDAGTGITASGLNATANQSINTTRTLSLNTTYTDARYVQKSGDTMNGQLGLPGGGGAFDALQRQEVEGLILSVLPPIPGDGAIEINAGTGLSASGSNATANQSVGTTRTLSLNTSYTDGRYVNKSGDTMTGDLTIPSLNGGQLAGFRNIIINGNLEVNQRGVDISSVSTGSYGQDRWKKTSGGMTQIIESGNYVPGAIYTLSGTNVTTRQLTAPFSGNWTLPNMPVSARKIQLELGTIATPFEYRSKTIEQLLCYRYFQFIDGEYRFDGILGPGSTMSTGAMWFFQQRMRGSPTLSTKNEGGEKAGDISWALKSSNGALGIWEWQDASNVTVRYKSAVVVADAEL